MKRFLNALLVVFAFTLLVAPYAVAQTCPSAPSGPHGFGSNVWWSYTPDPSCVVAYGSPTPSSGSMWCGGPAWETGTGWAMVSYTFTVDPNASEPYWTAEAEIEFDDPNDSSSNYVEVWAGVTHNGSTTYTMIGYHDGSWGELSCQRVGGAFNATDNDEVSIQVYSVKANSNATIQVGKPLIFSSN